MARNHNKKNDSFFPTVDSVDKTLASTIYKLHPVTKCLEESLKECIFEKNYHHDHDDEDSDSDIKIHKSFQNKLLNKYGESMVQAYHTDDILVVNAEEEEEQVLEVKPHSKKKHTTTDHISSQAPAALLTGKIKHYNRYEGNWRIVVTDAILRPRINIPYTDKSEANVRKRTLFHHSSVMEMERMLKRTKSNEESTRMNHSLLPYIHEDGSVHLDGDVVILAYDDYVVDTAKRKK
jgi:hypothetical protein